MTIIIYITSILSFILIGSHFLRDYNFGLALVSVLVPFLFFIRKRWILYIASGLLFLSAGLWINTALNFSYVRIELEQPYFRMLIILGAVSLFTAMSGFLILSKRFRRKYIRTDYDVPAVSSFFVSGFIISMAFIKVKFPIVLLERFLPGFGWFEIFILSLYAAFITQKILDKSNSVKWRRIIWSLFSFVFLAQLLIGILGNELFLMTGKLHIPVPAIILAGPLYRWEISIMVFLFIGSLVFIGPAWCSYLCYFGAWDDYFSRKKSKPKQLPANKQIIRISIVIVVILIALIMNYLGVSATIAAITGLSFGILGVVVMILYSRKKGVMAHCVVFCPIGLFAILFGKISPFRIKIDNSCTDCAQCHLSCRYDALNIVDIKNRKPNINCTLCGDCLGVCEHSSINYRFLKLHPENARKLFVIIAVSMHAAFMALGRL